jgi:hypothetical protein
VVLQPGDFYTQFTEPFFAPILSLNCKQPEDFQIPGCWVCRSLHIILGPVPLPALDAGFGPIRYLERFLNSPLDGTRSGTRSQPGIVGLVCAADPRQPEFSPLVGRAGGQRNRRLVLYAGHLQPPAAIYRARWIGGAGAGAAGFAGNTDRPDRGRGERSAAA